MLTRGSPLESVSTLDEKPIDCNSRTMIAAVMRSLPPPAAGAEEGEDVEGAVDCPGSAAIANWLSVARAKIRASRNMGICPARVELLVQLPSPLQGSRRRGGLPAPAKRC